MILCVTESDSYRETELALLLNALPPRRRAAAERARHPDTARAHILGYALTAYAARQLFPDALTGDFLLGESGKPRFADSRIRFSLSHTAYGVAVAVWDGEEIGCDLEAVRPLRPALLRRFACARELSEIEGAADRDGAAIALWTKKEAQTKRTGVGIGQDLRKVSTSACKTAELWLGGVRHMLSLCPCSEMPEITLVAPHQLL